MQNKNWIETACELPNNKTGGVLLTVAWEFSRNNAESIDDFIDLCNRVSLPLTCLSSIDRFSSCDRVKRCYAKMIDHIHALAVEHIDSPKVAIDEATCVVLSSGLGDVKSPNFGSILSNMLLLSEPSRGAYHCDYKTITVGQNKFHNMTCLSTIDLTENKQVLRYFKGFYKELIKNEGSTYYKETYRCLLGKLDSKTVKY